MTSRIPLESKLLLTTGEAATLLGVSDSHVRRMAHDGELPSIWVGKRHMIPRQQLLDWIDANTCGACGHNAGIKQDAARADTRAAS